MLPSKPAPQSPSAQVSRSCNPMFTILNVSTLLCKKGNLEIMYIMIWCCTDEIELILRSSYLLLQRPPSPAATQLPLDFVSVCNSICSCVPLFSAHSHTYSQLPYHSRHTLYLPFLTAPGWFLYLCCLVFVLSFPCLYGRYSTTSAFSVYRHIPVCSAPSRYGSTNQPSVASGQLAFSVQNPSFHPRFLLSCQMSAPDPKQTIVLSDLDPEDLELSLLPHSSPCFCQD